MDEDPSPAADVPALDVTEPEVIEPGALGPDGPATPASVPSAAGVDHEPAPVSEPGALGPDGPATPASVPSAAGVDHEPATAAPVPPGPVADAPTPPLKAGDEDDVPPLPPLSSGGADVPAAGTGPAPGDDTGEPAQRTKAPWSRVAVVAAAVGVVVAVLGIGLVGYLIAKSTGEKVKNATSTTSTTVKAAPVDTANWVTETDEASGFTLKHPRDWEKLPSQGDVKLLLRLGAESVVGVSARDVDASVAPDVIQQAMADVELLETPRQFNLNDVPAAVYIYKKPVSTDNPAEGVVVHYFAITQSKMYAMVFVTSPPEELNRLGRTISAVAESFKSTFGGPTPEPTTTTPTTTAGTTSTTG